MRGSTKSTPSLWQAASYHRFVLGAGPGSQFNQRDLARWVMQQFGREEELYSLFRAQYAFREKAREAGYRKNRISFWAFTDLENQQVPNFYLPINDFADRLVYLGALQRVAEGGTALDPEVVRQLLAAPAVDAGLARLSVREKEILGLLAEGRSNIAITGGLHLAERSVEKHVTAIFTKLDLPPARTDHRRVLAVLRYLNAGL